MSNCIESRITAVIRKAEIFSENGEHEAADSWLDNMLTALELQAERLRDAQNQTAASALRRKEVKRVQTETGHL